MVQPLVEIPKTRKNCPISGTPQSGRPHSGHNSFYQLQQFQINVKYMSGNQFSLSLTRTLYRSSCGKFELEELIDIDIIMTIYNSLERFDTLSGKKMSGFLFVGGKFRHLEAFSSLSPDQNLKFVTFPRPNLSLSPD